MARVSSFYFSREEINSAEIRGKNNHLFLRISPPKGSQSSKQFFQFGFAIDRERLQKIPNALTLFGQMHLHERASIMLGGIGIHLRGVRIADRSQLFVVNLKQHAIFHVCKDAINFASTNRVVR